MEEPSNEVPAASESCIWAGGAFRRAVPCGGFREIGDLRRCEIGANSDQCFGRRRYTATVPRMPPIKFPAEPPLAGRARGVAFPEMGRTRWGFGWFPGPRRRDATPLRVTWPPYRGHRADGYLFAQIPRRRAPPTFAYPGETGRPPRRKIGAPPSRGGSRFPRLCISTIPVSRMLQTPLDSGAK